ncbi:phosphatidate cytidylyltransferase, partial [Streptomyces drozdowiczii]|nr:phosphatidate cytidylyltransferase [Streptomyces drozdowiczii]
MNDSSWGAPQGAGHWVAPEMQGAAAGPAYDVHDAQQTRPMPIVPDVPDAGRDAEDRDHRDQGAGRLSGGPLFRDEKPQEPMPTAP